MLQGPREDVPDVGGFTLAVSGSRVSPKEKVSKVPYSTVALIRICGTSSIPTPEPFCLPALLPHLLSRHGCLCGSEDASADEIPSRIQSEGGHAEGQCRGHEEVSISIASRTTADEARTGG
jgi:hypothetical protein